MQPYAVFPQQLCNIYAAVMQQHHPSDIKFFTATNSTLFQNNRSSFVVSFPLETISFVGVEGIKQSKMYYYLC